MAKRAYQSKLEQTVKSFGEAEEKKEENVNAAPQEEAEAENVPDVEAETVSDAETEEEDHRKVYPEVPVGFMIRRTFYLTYVQSEAIDALAFKDMCGKSEIMRRIVESGIKALDPDGLANAAVRAEVRKRRDFYALTEEQREKAIKKAARD